MGQPLADLLRRQVQRAAHDDDVHAGDQRDDDRPIKLSSEDQSLLVNTLDATVRYRDTNWDNRAVVREQYNANFVDGKDNVNKLNALYGEARYLPHRLFGRIGRQSATSNGVLGRFDGAVGAWGFTPNARVAAVVGQPVDTYAGLDKTFYGGALEADVPGVAAGGNVYAIRQTVIGETDRLGVGAEARYFDAQEAGYALVDYDTGRRIAREAFLTMDLPEVDADAAADRCSILRLENLYVLPGALLTLELLRSRGYRLGLLTNGDGETQRYKIERFGLGQYFETILIEGEIGYGKPDLRMTGWLYRSSN